MLCTCGNGRYTGRQILRVDVVVNERGDYVNGVNDDLAQDIYDAGKPYGPFTCTNCGVEYDELGEG